MRDATRTRLHPRRVLARHEIQRAVLGLVCGLVTIFALYPFGTLVNWGVHAGIFGLAVNLLVVCISRRLAQGRRFFQFTHWCIVPSAWPISIARRRIPSTLPPE